MVTNSKGPGAKKKGKVKVMKLNKETVKDLSAKERKKIKAGLGVASALCVGTGDTCKCIRPPRVTPPASNYCDTNACAF